MKKNFSVDLEGKTYWISRSIVTIVFVIKESQGKVFLLTEKRGKGASNNVGKWCVPGGFLDYDETCEECALRELKEECGFLGDESKLKLLKINSSPREEEQNVSVHYLYQADEKENFDLKKARGGEKDEVSAVKWYQIGKLSKDGYSVKVDLYGIVADNWAFDHKKRTLEYLSQLYTLEYDD